MQISIIREDGIVNVDGLGFDVDTSVIPERVRAVQFNTSTGKGHVEFTDAPNETITSLGAYQALVDAWQERKDYLEAKAADPFYDLSVEQAKELKISQVLAILSSKKAETYDDGTNQLSPYGIQSIDELEALALMVRAEGDTSWTTEVILDNLEPDGTQRRVTLTAVEIIGKIRELRQRNEDLNQMAQGHIDMITLLTTVEEVRDYNLPA